MSNLIISRPDGDKRYPVPQFDQLTYKELATIERYTGIPASRWDEGMQSITFPVVLAYLATQRAGEVTTIEEIESLPGTAISIEDDDELVPTVAAEGGALIETTSAEPGTPDS
jgi:hypothetical protein